jgi:hypothetical protein
VVDSFGSITKPTSTSITNEIEKLLGEKAQWVKKELPLLAQASLG